MKLLNAVKYFLIIMCVIHLTTSSYASSSGFALRRCMVMDGPYRDANKIAYLDKGASLEILNRKGGWLKISAGDIQGWVRMLYIKRGEVDSKPSAGTKESSVLGLATGRSGSGNVVAATGVRGLGEEDLKEAEGKENTNLNFKWAVLRLNPGNQYEVLNNLRRPQLSSEDLIKIYIHPITNVYVYVYLLDSRNELQLIFPGSLDFFDSDYKFGEDYYIPVGENFFTIDEHKGTEKLYLLASVGRLKELESLTREFINVSEDKKITAKAEVLKEIKGLKTRFSKSSSSSEKPIPIAAAFRTRGLEGPNGNLKATQVNAANFYSKTIRLEHK